MAERWPLEPMVEGSSPSPSVNETSPISRAGFCVSAMRQKCASHHPVGKGEAQRSGVGLLVSSPYGQYEALSEANSKDV
jgi:hypothetical protein